MSTKVLVLASYGSLFCKLHTYHLLCLMVSLSSLSSVAKIKVLDASAPLALPSLLAGASGMALTTVISALSFSQDGEVPYIHSTCLDVDMNLFYFLSCFFIYI